MTRWSWLLALSLGGCASLLGLDDDDVNDDVVNDPENGSPTGADGSSRGASSGASSPGTSGSGPALEDGGANLPPRPDCTSALLCEDFEDDALPGWKLSRDPDAINERAAGGLRGTFRRRVVNGRSAVEVLSRPVDVTSGVVDMLAHWSVDEWTLQNDGTDGSFSLLSVRCGTSASFHVRVERAADAGVEPRVRVHGNVTSSGVDLGAYTSATWHAVRMRFEVGATTAQVEVELDRRGPVSFSPRRPCAGPLEISLGAGYDRLDRIDISYDDLFVTR